MNHQDVLFHLLNFVAPAFALALLVPSLAWPIWRRRALLPWWLQALVNFAVGVAVLLACLVWLGRDGKMTTYGLLVLAVGSTQWLLVGGWRR